VENTLKKNNPKKKVENRVKKKLFLGTWGAKKIEGV